MAPIACGRLKPVSNLGRPYSLRMPAHRSWGRTRFWQLLPRLLAMRISYKWLPLSLSLSLSLSLVPLQIGGLVLRIGCKVWEIEVVEGGAGALLVPRPLRGRSYVYSPHRLRDSHD
jgi:hypothetical protein